MCAGVSIGLLCKIPQKSNYEIIGNPKKLDYLWLVIIFEQTKSDGMYEAVEVSKYCRIDSTPFVVLKGRGDNELLSVEVSTLVEVRF
jgi:hypothetical protein